MSYSTLGRGCELAHLPSENGPTIAPRPQNALVRRKIFQTTDCCVRASAGHASAPKSKYGLNDDLLLAQLRRSPGAYRCPGAHHEATRARRAAPRRHPATVEERTTTARRNTTSAPQSTRGSAVRQGPSDFEWAIDADASRNDGDNFHILLLNETFAKPRMSVAYAAGALTLVLAMPEPDAIEHAGFAQAQGFSCLGTWRKDECLELCEQLRGRT